MKRKFEGGVERPEIPGAEKKFSLKKRKRKKEKKKDSAV